MTPTPNVVACGDVGWRLASILRPSTTVDRRIRGEDARVVILDSEGFLAYEPLMRRFGSVSRMSFP